MRELRRFVGFRHLRTPGLRLAAHTELHGSGVGPGDCLQKIRIASLDGSLCCLIAKCEATQRFASFGTCICLGFIGNLNFNFVFFSQENSVGLSCLHSDL